MISKKLVSNISIVCLLTACMGCKQRTSPNGSSTSSTTGTLVFGAIVDEVSSSVLGSGATTVLFQGDNPAFTSDGRIICEVLGGYNSDNDEHIVVSTMDGSSKQTLVNLQTSIESVQAHPKMSPDGKYVSFNYWEDIEATLGSHYGTLVYTSTGTPAYYIDSLFDASWAPDGSLILSGSVTSYDDVTRTFAYEGLFKVDKNFTSVTQIGTGLTTPQYPTVNPAGTKIAFAMNNHIWVIGMDGTGLKQITSGPNAEYYSAWSPDGSEIAAESEGSFAGGSGSSIAIVSATPSTPTTVSGSSSVWVQDKNNIFGVVGAQGNIDWKR